jgi:hypothetical protein
MSSRAFKISFLVLISLFFATNAEAAFGPILRCQNIATGCTFTDFVIILNTAVDYIVYIVSIIMTIMFARAGFLYMTSGDNAANREKAKNSIKNVLIGIVIVLCAWVLVTTILKWIVKDGSAVLKFLGN